MKLVLTIALAMALACFANAAFNPPVYRQGDSRWGNYQLGFGSYTIAKKGCFLTCQTSMIASQGITINNGETPDPENMNEWFKDNDQFDGGMLLYNAPQKFGFRYEGKSSSKSQAVNAFNQGKFVMLHVNNLSHWVLVTSILSDGYQVMDPAGRKTSFKFSEVPEVAIYTAPAGMPGTKDSVEVEVPRDEAEEPTAEPEPEIPHGAFNPPVYRQGDKKWGSNLLGFGPVTIAKMGCWLTCQASMIASQGITINGKTVDPQTMNEWAKVNDQFDNGHSLLYKAPTKFGFGYEGKTTSSSEMKNAFNEGKFVILHVKNYSHWVLVTSVSSSEYQVMDPAGVRTSYKFSEAPEAAIYTAPAGKPGTSSS